MKFLFENLKIGNEGYVGWRTVDVIVHIYDAEIVSVELKDVTTLTEDQFIALFPGAMDILVNAMESAANDTDQRA